MQHLIALHDLSRDQLERVLELSEELRGKRTLQDLAGRTVVLVFFNPSLRTRVSMEVAAQELGARAVTLDVGQGVWKLEPRDGVRMDGDAAEHVKEAARVLARYGDLLAVRAFPGQKSWEEDRKDLVVRSFEKYSTVPVVNLESSLYHPCQSLADILTIRRLLGDKPGKICLAWCNHPKPLPVAVPSSFALAMTQMGWDLAIARPDGHDLPPEIMARCRDMSAQAGAQLTVTSDRDAALSGARIVYAKSWGRLDRYGEAEREIAERREGGLDRWIIDDRAMSLTDDGRFMHCLPVRRNVVVTDSVLDGPSCIVYDQAENRLHAQKGLIKFLLP